MPKPETAEAETAIGETCPRCGQPAVRHAEGCALCLSCDHSKCA